MSFDLSKNLNSKDSLVFGKPFEERDSQVLIQKKIGPIGPVSGAGGGTVILGGTSSGDGALSVRDRAGTEIVLLDERGITINNGSVTINGTNGTAILDGDGIISINNFSIADTVAGTLNQVIAGTATEDLTGGSYNLVLNRAALTYLPFQCQVYLVEPGTNTCGGQVFIEINGSQLLDPKNYITIDSGNTSTITQSSYELLQLSAGTNVVKLQARLAAVNGTASMTVVRFRESYVVLGR